MTNATKAGIVAAVNAAMGVVAAFGLELTTAQQGAIITAVNAGLGLWVALTYKNSAKRVPDEPAA